MPTPPLPTRHQVDAAEPLDFPPTPARNAPHIDLRTKITIEIAPDGLHVTAEYTGLLDSIPAAVERLQRAGVLELVRQSRPSPAPSATPAAGQQRKPAERVEPAYKPDGTPCCPKHHKPLKTGQWGLFCPAKDDTTERGYCSLKFAE